jgi:hypothetical protein
MASDGGQPVGGGTSNTRSGLTGAATYNQMANSPAPSPPPQPYANSPSKGAGTAAAPPPPPPPAYGDQKQKGAQEAQTMPQSGQQGALSNLGQMNAMNAALNGQQATSGVPGGPMGGQQAVAYDNQKQKGAGEAQPMAQQNAATSSAWGQQGQTASGPWANATPISQSETSSPMYQQMHPELQGSGQTQVEASPWKQQTGEMPLGKSPMDQSQYQNFLNQRNQGGIPQYGSPLQLNAVGQYTGPQPSSPVQMQQGMPPFSQQQAPWFQRQQMTPYTGEFGGYGGFGAGGNYGGPTWGGYGQPIGGFDPFTFNGAISPEADWHIPNSGVQAAQDAQNAAQAPVGSNVPPGADPWASGYRGGASLNEMYGGSP